MLYKVILRLKSYFGDLCPVVTVDNTAAVAENKVSPSAVFKIGFVGGVNRECKTEGFAFVGIDIERGPRNGDFINGKLLVIVAGTNNLALEFLGNAAVFIVAGFTVIVNCKAVSANNAVLVCVGVDNVVIVFHDVIGFGAESGYLNLNAFVSVHSAGIRGSDRAEVIRRAYLNCEINVFAVVSNVVIGSGVVVAVVKVEIRPVGVG